MGHRTALSSPIHDYHGVVFAGVLNDEDARRATEIVEAVLAHGIRCALTGGLAIDAQLRKHGRPGERRSLNDIDFVVEDFASIPESPAGAFQHHVHPEATDGRTLLQLVDQPRAIRIDLFRALGGSLSRASKLTHETGELDVLSVEDLVARTTAFVCGRLRRGETFDGKHAVAFSRLRGLGQPQVLAAAWNDHRQQVPGALEDASREAVQLLKAHPELIVVEEYSSTPVACGRCRAHGAFRPAPTETIVEVLATASPKSVYEFRTAVGSLRLNLQAPQSVVRTFGRAALISQLRMPSLTPGQLSLKIDSRRTPFERRPFDESDRLRAPGDAMPGVHPTCI